MKYNTYAGVVSPNELVKLSVFLMRREVISWGSASGTGNTVSIEWHGKAELYTGSQENLLTESDLK